MQRREFTKLTFSASLGAIALPNIITKHAEEPQILGHGKFKYKLVKNWGVDNLINTPVNDCHEMVQDSKKRLIFCTNETKNNIIILNTSGKLISSWGHDFPGAHGLTLSNENGEEFLFVTDTVKNEVYKTTLDGRILMTLGYPIESGVYNDKEKVKFCPTETAIAPNGDIYVADGYGSSYIIVYDSKGKFKNIFAGQTGKEDGLIQAHGVCIDTRDKKNPIVIGTSRSANAYKTYTLDGKLLKTYEVPGAYVCRAVIKNDNLYFPVIINNTTDWNSRTGFFIVLDKNHKIISAPGAKEIVYEGNKTKVFTNIPGTFMHCHDICIDNDENVYIPQWNSAKTFPLKLERV